MTYLIGFIIGVITTLAGLAALGAWLTARQKKEAQQRLAQQRHPSNVTVLPGEATASVDGFLTYLDRLEQDK